MSGGRVRFVGGRQSYVKRWDGAPAGFFLAEAAGLEWLREAAAVAVPEVVAADETSIAVGWIEPVAPNAETVARLGRELADLHAAGPPAFGASWPGFVGSLPMANGPAPDWPTFYAERRLLPFLRSARDLGRIGDEGVAAVERVADRLPELAGPAEPPARIHGDLWSGNVVFGSGVEEASGTAEPPGATSASPRTEPRAWLIDPAAHGGHRETDLAMLALFGFPHLDRLLAAYHEHRPLAPGWEDRVGLHQLHPLLVHAILFGGGYADRVLAVAREYR